MKEERGEGATGLHLRQGFGGQGNERQSERKTKRRGEGATRRKSEGAKERLREEEMSSEL